MGRFLRYFCQPAFLGISAVCRLPRILPVPAVKKNRPHDCKLPSPQGIIMPFAVCSPRGALVYQRIAAVLLPAEIIPAALPAGKNLHRFAVFQNIQFKNLPVYKRISRGRTDQKLHPPVTVEIQKHPAHIVQRPALITVPCKRAQSGLRKLFGTPFLLQCRAVSA